MDCSLAAADGEYMGPVEEPTLLEKIEQERHILAASRKRIKELADLRDPQVGPELTIAYRAVEDGRMRLGVAAAVLKGLDPWASEIKD